MNALLHLFEMQTHHQVVVRSIIASLFFAIAAVFIGVALWQFVYPNAITPVIGQIKVMTFILAMIMSTPAFYAVFFMSLQVWRKNREMFQLANLDPLTGIYNRRAFLGRFNKLLQKARSSGEIGTFLIIDVDKFKSINDRLGHDIGDKVLIHLAENLRTLVGANNCFARLGGEEFAVACFGVSEADAFSFAEKIRAGIENAPLKNDGFTVMITVSIGYCEVDSNSTLNTALRQADKALYVAKRNGRNRVSSFNIAAPELIPETTDLVQIDPITV